MLLNCGTSGLYIGQLLGPSLEFVKRKAKVDEDLRNDKDIVTLLRA